MFVIEIRPLLLVLGQIAADFDDGHLLIRRCVNFRLGHIGDECMFSDAGKTSPGPFTGTFATKSSSAVADSSLLREGG